MTDYLGLLYGGGMRTLRQILHGCKKHHYVYFRDIEWFEDSYCLGRFKAKLVCKNCMHVDLSKVDMMICRSELDYIRYEKLKLQAAKQQSPKRACITEWNYLILTT